jgi:hypothetical protein
MAAKYEIYQRVCKDKPYDAWLRLMREISGIDETGLTGHRKLHEWLNREFPKPRIKQARRNRIRVPSLPHCGGKASYLKRNAETILNVRQRNSNKELRMYQCDKCDYWHLAHVK